MSETSACLTLAEGVALIREVENSGKMYNGFQHNHRNRAVGVGYNSSEADQGTPDDVKREMAWVVDKGPKIGLFLGGSSSITPGVPWENIQTLIEGLKYYREHGR